MVNIKKERKERESTTLGFHHIEVVRRKYHLSLSFPFVVKFAE